MIWNHLRRTFPWVAFVALLCGLAIPSDFLADYPIRLAYGLIMLVLVVRVFIYLAPRAPGCDK